MIVIDTNILVYAHRAAATEHRAAIRVFEWLRQNGDAWAITLPTVAEFWMVVTHPSSIGGPSKPDVAARFLDALLTTGGGTILQPRSGFGSRLVQLYRDLAVSGPRVFDAQIALIALEHGARTIYSHDRRFITVPGIEVLDPVAAS